MLGYVLASGALLRGKKKGMTAGSHLCWDDSKPSLFLLRGRAGKENTRGHALRSPPNRATARILFPKEKTGKEKKRSSCPGHPCPPLMAEKQVTGEEGRRVSGGIAGLRWPVPEMQQLGKPAAPSAAVYPKSCPRTADGFGWVPLKEGA